MLTLERTEGEAILIGPVKVIVFRINDGRSVKIKIDAPDNVPILRDELPQYEPDKFNPDRWSFQRI